VLSPLFRRPRLFAAVAVALLSLIATGVYFARRPSPPELAFSEFLQRIDTGQVKQVRFEDGSIALVLTDGSNAVTVPPPSVLTADSTFIANLARRGVRIEIQQVPSPGALTASSVAIAAFFLAVLGFTV